MPVTPGPALRAASATFLSWQEFTPGPLAAIIAREAGLDPATAVTLARIVALPFFPGVALAALGFAGMAHDVFALIRGDALAEGGVLTGTNEPWYHQAETAIELNDRTVALYARCFFHFVKGTMGSFRIVENPADIPWREDALESQRAEAAGLLVPLTLLGQDRLRRLHLTTTVLFRDALFRTDILVDTETAPANETLRAELELMDEIVLLEDLAVQVAS